MTHDIDLNQTILSRFQVRGEYAGLRSDLFVALQVPTLSRRRIRQKIQEGHCTVNGRRCTVSTRLRAGDQVELRRRQPADLPEGAPDGDPPDDPVPSILYEDDFLLAVNKPAGVPVHPVGRKQSGTLIQVLHRHYRERIEQSLAESGGDFYPSLVNRLDQFTSGVVLLAKEREVLRRMHRLIAAGSVRKRYAALVRGRVDPPVGSIDRPLGPEPDSRVGIRRGIRPDGLPSRTEYRVIEHLDGHTLLLAFPLTGRQHQIRVHFAAAGHPVWGDLIYDDEELFLRYVANGCRLDASLPPRQGLHAEWLAFSHPCTGLLVEITAPWPEDFTRIVEKKKNR